MAKRLDKPNRKTRVVAAFSIASIIAVVGSISGTYAWFEYEARAGLKYTGAAIKDIKELQIGVISEKDLSKSEYFIKDDTIENAYFCKEQQSLNSNALMEYTSLNGYAQKEVSPVTSGSFKSGDKFSLKTAPVALMNYDENQLANKTNYQCLSLIFRAPKDSSVSMKDRRIVLQDATVEGSGTVALATRIAFISQNSSYIFNPNNNTKSEEIVGGPLDLNLDGYYDYDKGKEYAYGEFEDLIYNEEPSIDDAPLDVESRDTFAANHFAGTYAIDMLNSKPKTAEVLGKSEVLSDLTLTSCNENEDYALLDVYIYAEGWSKHLNQKQEHNYFSLELTFEARDL